MEATSKSRFVKIKKERGYGDDIYYVRGYNSRTDEFTLENTEYNATLISMFRSHCYVDRDTIRAS